MKAKRFLTLMAMLLLAVVTAFAQAKDEVTLTVSGDGATKEEATKIALRSAIEQAYGTFVSANTQILNDELVKDEIVTVSSGNVKSYKEISCLNMQNKIVVTLQATVCISKLVSYAQSKGASAELAGATFAMNMKIKELNKQNELKALQNMVSLLMSYGNVFDYKLDIGEPRVYDDNNYGVDATIHVLFTDKLKSFNEVVFNTLSSLSLSEQEVKEYERLGLSVYPIIIQMPREKIRVGNGQKGLPTIYESSQCYVPYKFYLRNKHELTRRDHFVADIIGFHVEREEFRNLSKIGDRTNVYGDPYVYVPDSYGLTTLMNYILWRYANGVSIENNLGTHLKQAVRYEDDLGGKLYNYGPWIYCRLRVNRDNTVTFQPIPQQQENGMEVIRIERTLLIPKEDIAKYSNFELSLDQVNFFEKVKPAK